jgi:sugar/nucleoside kinase (ribokinase family)
MTDTNDTEFDVIGVGSAIVDVLSHTDDAFLEAHGMAKGSMALVESEEDAEKIYAAMGPGVEISGGSVANSMVGVASFGGRAAFLGLVRDDQLGEVFAHDIRAAGVSFDVAPRSEGPSTARCMILVTPDAQRTLNTFLGISNQFGSAELDTARVAASRVLFCEGYLWDVPEAKEAMVEAMTVASAANRKVAMTLSDPFCVERHRAEFLALAEGRIDILFANEEEVCSLYEVDEFDEALQRVRGHCDIACLTRSAKGSVIVAGEEVHVIDAYPTEVVDTTGAGDLYAAGVLYGYTRGLDLATSGRLGARAAAEVISHLGARPEVSLSELAAELT